MEGFTHVHYTLVYPDGYKRDIYVPIIEELKDGEQGYLDKKLQRYTKTRNLIVLRQEGYKLLLIGLTTKVMK